MTRTISAGIKPNIEIINVKGNLSLVGWEAGEILIKADEDELKLQQDGDRISLSCDGDLVMRVPRSAAVSLGQVSGEMSLRSVAGEIVLKEIGNDLSIRDIGSASIESVQGNFSLRGARGNLEVKQILGDASVRDVTGNVTLGTVADDLALRDVGGSIQANVSEDVVLSLTPISGNTYSVKAGDGILLVLPAHADAVLTLQGDEIDIDWPGIENDEQATIRELTLGNGAARIALNAGGNVRLTSRLDAADSADEFGNFAGIHFDWSGLDEKFSRRMEQVAHKVEKTAKAAARQVERNVQRHARRWKVNLNPDYPVSSVEAGQDTVTDEERMAILKMLQDKKITAAEADQLLNALEGGRNA